MSDCAEFETLLALRADHALEGEAVLRLEHHLEHCAGCRALSDALGATMSELHRRASAAARRKARDGNAPSVTRRGESEERPLPSGELVGGRFLIERLESQGGMGVVYRAIDLEWDSPVALKIMRGRSDEFDRFVQEARVLAELSHPSIVRYIAHGARPTGELYLAMEWLTGETLADRLDRAPLGAAESVALARRAAAGLADAHARGIVHRDVKPSNLFLVGGDPQRLKLLDFGIARMQVGAQAMTRTGAIIGTVGYMAPEQARGLLDVDARADVFALGCVLFECLAGRPAFVGASLLATLAKVVLEDAPRLATVRPDLPRELDELVRRMLAKDREQRPASAAALVEALEALGAVDNGPPPPRSSAAVSTGERRLISLLLARPERGEVGQLQALAKRFSGNPAQLAEGTLLVTFGAPDTATDLAAQAASCALALKEAGAAAAIALATGRVETSGQHPVGPVIDRAAELLEPATADGISVDEVTAGLLDARFDVRPQGDRRVLVGTRTLAANARPLLGKATPFVGREKELALLEATLSESVAESVARAVLVTAAPGVGKSRLRHEFVRRAMAMEQVGVLVARADPMAAGSSLSLIRQLVRGAAMLRAGDPLAEQHEQLRVYLATRPARLDAELLGELAGAPSMHVPSLELRGARNDSATMAEGLRRAFHSWIAAECSARPLLVVLEDLNWGDAPSVTWIGEAVKRLAERPLMVLALARPEARTQFPPLWTQEIALAGLTRRAAERLVRATLGDEIAADLLGRIVERAEGNAYYLEELIRCAREGVGGELPETVLAMVQSRLQRLEPEARRVLRAASVYGETFWAGAAAALVGEHAEVADWLRTLVDRELIQPREPSRFRGEAELAFRHGLLRDAAYASLTEVDRAAAHRLAAGWLEAAGERDARVLADHFELGGSPDKALPWLVGAAQAALDAGNMEAALALGDRGIACGAKEDLLGRLLEIQGEAYLMEADASRAADRARKALDLLPAGSTAWFSAASAVSFANLQLLDPIGMLELVRRVAALTEVPLPDGPVASACSMLLVVLFTFEQFEAARGVAELLEQAAARAPEHDPTFAGFLCSARAFVAQFVTGDLDAMVRNARRSVTLLDQGGSILARVYVRGFACVVLLDAGRYDEVRRLSREGVALAEAAGLPVTMYLKLWLSAAEVLAGNPSVAVSYLEPLLPLENVAVSSVAGEWLAEAYLALGRLDDAERIARPLTHVAQGGAKALVHAVLARVDLARGQAQRALEATTRAGSVAVAAASTESATLRLVRVEALAALGERDAVRAELALARDRIIGLARTLGDLDERERYLTGVGANRRTLDLARELLEGR
jgi:hypothetical protein